MARGDILFYTGDGGAAARIVELVTRGRFVHVELDDGNGFAIGALSGGVSRHALVPPAARVTVPDLSALDAGIAWLEQQVTRHDEYSPVDIFDNLPGLPFTLAVEGHYDCSHLVASYLLHAGGAAWLGPFADMPERTSPNDLARLAGLDVTVGGAA